MLLLLALCAIFLLQGCGVTKDISAAQKEIIHFHAQLDAGKYADIYDQASPTLKKASSKSDFIDLLSAIHRKIGLVKSSTESAWNINSTLAGTFVTLSYHTEYAGGGADEQFVYQIKNKTATLVGYHINSMALIIK